MALRDTMALGKETASRVPYICRLAPLEPAAARFLNFLTKVKGKTEDIRSTEYTVQERRPRGQNTTLGASGSATAAAQQLTFASTAHLSVGDLIFIGARAYQARVNSVDSATLATVIALDAVSQAATPTSGDNVVRVGRVMNEGYTVGSSYLTDTTQVTNYASTLSTPVEWTNLQALDQSYLSDDQKSNRMKADERAMAIEHMREIDKQLWFSVKSKTTDGNGCILYTTNGMLNTISTNVYDHTGSAVITEAVFNQSIVEPNWRNNGPSTKKWLFASNKVLTIFEGFGIGRLQFQEVESRDLGFDINAYRTTRGTLEVTHCPHFDGTYYDEGLVIVDPNFVKLAILEDTKYEKNLQPKNVKRILNEWSTKVGLWVAYEEAHSKARDLRTGT